MTAIKQRIEDLSTRDITLIMILVTLVIPHVILPGGAHHSGLGRFLDIKMYSLLWSIVASFWMINADSSTGGSITEVAVINPNSAISVSIYCLFNILFAIQVIRFCRNETSKRFALTPGIISIVFPIYFFLQFYIYLFDFIEHSGILLYIGPIPIQLIIGLLIMRYAGPWSVTKPWDEDEKGEKTWWKEESKT